MPELSIRARFPLGVFRGHEEDGSFSRAPSPSRLFSALTHAAHTGCTAITSDKGALIASPQAETALRWMENHRPVAIELPQRCHENARTAVTYRDEGVFTTQDGRWKTFRDVSGGQAMAGHFGWRWAEDCPEDIVQTVKELCHDVGYLGEADCPTILELGPITATHHLDPSAGVLAIGGFRTECVVAGRLDELRQAFATANPVKRPSLAADKANWSAKPSSPKPTRFRVSRTFFREIDPVPADLPWTEAVLLPTTAVFSPYEQVSLAVSLHRALISRIGDGAPPSITGVYPKGQHKPANRVAIHYLPPGTPSTQTTPEQGAFALLLPQSMDPEEVSILMKALRGMTFLQRPSGKAHLEQARVVSAADFWNPPQPGFSRVWSPRPALVPEIRGVRDEAPWTFRDTCLLSAAFLLRDQLETWPNGGDRFRERVRLVTAHGIRVAQTHRITDVRMERFVHKAPDGMTVQPYTALVDMGGTLSPTALWALGQSRHLGGGLMIPVDIPTDQKEVWFA